MDKLELFNALILVATPVNSNGAVATSLDQPLAETGLDSLDLLMMGIYLSDIYGVPEEIAKEIDLAARQAYNTELPPDTRAKARTFLSAAEKFRTSLGVPVRIYTEEDAKQLPIGTQYLWQGRIPAIRRGAPGGKK